MNPDTRTALIYDEEMTKYKLLWVDPACKIEVPERLTVSYEALMKTGLADRCVSVPVREATDEDILLVHRFKNSNFDNGLGCASWSRCTVLL
uniref:Histone deacetylase domain-containing protein n=1 Tax=Periophthalmus magnuspinnatus TaxID=409849 RepID=A0A3B4B0K4_9GOBI